MATQKQIDANRANAAKSTGPRSAEGKSASSMNALKSGIDAQSQIVRGEKVENLELLKNEYHARFRPVTPEQRMLVDTLIDSEWLLRRFRVVEAQLWEYESRSPINPQHDIPLGQAVHRNDQIFVRLQRRINTVLETYQYALKELRKLQAEFVPAEAEQEPELLFEVEQNQSPEPEIGFVPQAPVMPIAAPTVPASPAPMTISGTHDGINCSA